MDDDQVVSTFELKTEVDTDGKITQCLFTKSFLGESLLNPEMMRFTTWIIDTREKGIREALIKLGWTPPSEDGAS
jgi:hypothetical protein